MSNKINPNRFQHLLAFFFLFMLFSLLSGCAARTSEIPLRERWGKVEGSLSHITQAGEQFNVAITIDDGLIAQGQPLKMKISGMVSSGSVRFELRQPDGQSVWDSGKVGAGEFSFNVTYNLPAEQTGIYEVGFVHSENISVTYNLDWQILPRGLSILVSGFGMIY